ncbi:MAG TPA: hypothetical protein VH439_04055, partial [Gemmatimonadales bacterium]
KYFQWWDRYVETSLGQWAVAEISERTHGVYTLVLGDLDFRPIAGSLSFDSALVITDTTLNRSRGNPLPTLRARATGCRISKVSVLGLMLLKRFEAGAMGCQVVATAVELAPATAPPKAIPSPPQPASPPAPQLPQATVDSGPRQILKPPLGIRKFEISNIAFPTLQFSIRRVRLRGEASFEIAHARLVGDKVEFDPTATPGTPEAFLSVGLRVGGSDLQFKPDPLTRYSLGGIDIGLSDSTLSLSNLTLGPSVTDEEWQRHQKTRRDRIRFSLDSLAAAGIQYRTLARTGEVHIRRVLLRGARFNVLSDKRLPAGLKKAHVTPQAAAQGTAPAVRIDTIVVDRSEISYLEHKPKRERPGRLDFADLTGRISNVDLPSSGSPLTIDLNTRLMGAGAMSVHATVPLDATDFRWNLTGRLGSMPASALNGFLEETLPIRAKGGQIDSMIFVTSTTGGVSKTTLTPYYRDLGIDFVSQGGVTGFLKAGLIEFGANKFKVRTDNPEESNKPPRSAKTSRRYEPTQSWLSFLWLGLRDGLLKTVVK